MSKTITILSNPNDFNKVPDKIDLIISKKEIKNAKNIQDYRSKEANKKSIYWLKEWSNKKIYNNKNFKELITYNNVPLWWFGDFWLHYHAIHNNTVMDIIDDIETLKNIIKKERPEKIICIGDYLINDVAEIICNKENIKFEKIYSKGINRKKPYIIEFMKRKKFFLRYLSSKIVFKNYKPKNSNKKILFSTYSSMQQLVTDPLTGNTKEQDLIFGQIIEKAKEQYEITISDIDYEPSLGIKHLKKKIIPFEYFYNSNIKRITSKEKSNLKKIWKDLEKNQDFKNSLSYEGIPLWNLLKEKFEFLITNRFPEAIESIEIAKNMLLKEKPILVFAIDETGLYGRSIIVAAKELKIPVFGMQHGLIGKDEAFEYIHLKEEIDSVPLPDITFVDGKNSQEILLKEGNYPKESVVVSGQPRYDFIPNINFKKEDVYKEFNLDPNKKLVLFATEATEEEESGDLPNAVIEGIKELDVNFIIKLHPREYKEAYYKDLLNKHNVTGHIIRKYNTFKLLHASDVVIVMHSTVGTEAAMLNKPIVVVNVTGKPDIADYVKDSIAIGTYSKSEVSKQIQEALYNTKIIERMKKNRKTFLENNVYRLDGKATERIIDITEKILKHNNSI